MQGQKTDFVVLDEIHKMKGWKNFNTDFVFTVVNDFIDFVESTLNAKPLAGKRLDSNCCQNPKSRHLICSILLHRAMVF